MGPGQSRLPDGGGPCKPRPRAGGAGSGGLFVEADRLRDDAVILRPVPGGLDRGPSQGRQSRRAGTQVPRLRKGLEHRHLRSRPAGLRSLRHLSMRGPSQARNPPSGGLLRIDRLIREKRD